MNRKQFLKVSSVVFLLKTSDLVASNSSEKQYVSNPNLPFVKKYKGNLFYKGKFRNDERRKQPGFSEMMEWRKAGNPQKKEKKADKFRVEVIKNTDFINSTEDMIVWLGHASFFIRMNGVTLLTDPCLENLPFLKRYVGLPCKIPEITGLDYILLSHGHRDHLDIPSLKKVVKANPDVQFLCPLKIGELLKPLKVTNIQEAGWWQQFDLTQDIKITMLPAKHWNRRGLTDFNLQLWGSFYLETNGKKVYFGGDSGKGGHFKEIAEVMGAPDVCMLGIGAYMPRVIMETSHTSPEEAVELFNEMEAKHFIPMHYATYDLSDEPISDPIKKVRKLHETGILEGELNELKVGEMFFI